MDTLYGTPFMPRGPRFSPGRARRGTGDDEMRVSDAERSEVADELAKHYADGRLDEAEFNERLAQAMGAKTRGDLAGLLTDLPSSPPTAPVSAPPPRARRAAGLILVTVLVLSLVAASWHLHLGLLALVFVVLLLWRRHHRHLHRWHGGHPGHDHWAGPSSSRAGGGDHWS